MRGVGGRFVENHSVPSGAPFHFVKNIGRQKKEFIVAVIGRKSD